ncbi:MAG: hypothetical protein ACRD12_05640 [Acidimicrobiales bacterium]
MGLDEPAWTTDGEVLNGDRYAHYGGPRFDEGLKYTCGEAGAAVFEQILGFLDDVVRPEGVAYKDVVQPFAVATWLAARPLRVVKIRRRVAEVAASMLAQGWYYPQAAAADVDDRHAAVVEGLVRADLALDTLAGETLWFDDLVTDERHLGDCLARLYPDLDVRPPSYIDDGFRRERRRQWSRRTSPALLGLERMVAGVRAAGGPYRRAPAPGDPEEEARRRPVRERIRRLACEVLPCDAVVVTMAVPADGLLNLDGRRAWNVPATLDDLDAALRRGATHLILPLVGATGALPPADLVERVNAYRTLHADDGCRIYDLA